MKPIPFCGWNRTTKYTRSVLHPESASNTEQRRYFVSFVSPGYKWPVGQDGPNPYVCRRSCQAKIQQGIVKAADLKKIVNELRDLHINESTSPQIEIISCQTCHLVNTPVVALSQGWRTQMTISRHTAVVWAEERYLVNYLVLLISVSCQRSYLILKKECPEEGFHMEHR